MQLKTQFSKILVFYKYNQTPKTFRYLFLHAYEKINEKYGIRVGFLTKKLTLHYLTFAL